MWVENKTLYQNFLWKIILGRYFSDFTVIHYMLSSNNYRLSVHLGNEVNLLILSLHCNSTSPCVGFS